ncbi:MAG: ThiF family adenylyltransferase [bacterium]
MQDAELLRYSRQIMLPEVDIAGQEALQNARVLIMGLGGLGSPAALYLAAAGIGNLVLCDDDEVELSNLQRQIAHSNNTIGVNKAESAAQTIHTLNPHVQTDTRSRRLTEDELRGEIANVDLVLDCTDNFASRHMINNICWQSRTPLVSGAAIRWEGQIAVFDANQSASPCYSCLYPNPEGADLNCAENGVIAPLVGIIGTCQALEAVKLITGVGDSLVGYVLYFDAKYMQWRKLTLNRRPNCPVCSASD